MHRSLAYPVAQSQGVCSQICNVRRNRFIDKEREWSLSQPDQNPSDMDKKGPPGIPGGP